MDNKAVFIRTRKGEEELSGKTAHLYSAIKRVLLMVDGVSTFGEISKRAAPSMRDSLDEMLQELEKGGFVKNQAKLTGIPKKSMSPKLSIPPKLSTPPRLAVPPQHDIPPKPPVLPQTPVSSKKIHPDEKPEQQAGGVLDLMDDFFASMPAKLAADAARAGQPEGNDAAKSQPTIDAAKLQAQNEAAAILLKAEQKAAAIRAAAEQEAAQLRAKTAEAKFKADQAEQALTQARAQAEKLAHQPVPILPSSPAASVLQASPTAPLPPAAEIKPDTEIKLDPFFIFDPFQIQPSPQSASQQGQASGIELEPEIKLDAFIFAAPDAPKSALTPLSVGAQAPSDAAKTTGLAQTGAVAKPAMPLPAPQSPQSPQSPRINPGQEQIKQDEVPRTAAAAQARPLSNEQSRDAAVAKASPELTFQKIAPAATQAATHRVPVARARRKSFPWGKFAIFVLVLLLSALFVVPYVLPMRDYLPKIEQLLSAKLHQPVHIGQLSGRILPTPRLEFGEIYIGDVKQFQAQQALINFPMLALLLGQLSEIKPIDSIELRSVKVTGAGLLAASSWLQQLAADQQYPVRRMVISQGMLDADAIQFTGIDGELNFDQAGQFSQANLRANADKITLGIIAAPASKLQVSLTMYASALPLLPGWSFDELSAKGELSSGNLSIKQFEGRTRGGIVQGDADIDWRSGWRAEGTLLAKAIAMQSLSQGVSGDMDGSARFQMQATSLSGLADTATLDGSFVVGKGSLNGIDIVETARSRSNESAPGGRTHFEQLRGVLSVSKDGYALRQLKMNAGALIVTGTLDITDQQLSGRVATDLSKWAGMGKVTLQVVGTTDNTSLRAAR